MAGGNLIVSLPIMNRAIFPLPFRPRRRRIGVPDEDDADDAGLRQLHDKLLGHFWMLFVT